MENSILDVLNNLLTSVQFKKIKKLFERYPELLKGKPVITSTNKIGKVLGVRSNNVYRDLRKIEDRTGRLRVEKAFIDTWDQTKIIEDLFGYEEKEACRGGRNNPRRLKITWRIY